MEADSLHRLAKALADSGEVDTLEEALENFSRYGIRVRLGSISGDPAAQVIALTVINAASRSFEGNVEVESDDFELTVPGFEGCSLAVFLSWAGVRRSPPEFSVQWPRVVIGESTLQRGDIRPWASGWLYGVGERGRMGKMFAPACVAAAGLAVSEAFSMLRHDNPYAGKRELNLSFWTESGVAPVPESIGHSGAWLVGLGHLGQAYAWTLGFMRPSVQGRTGASVAQLVLQDVDHVTKSTLSTSLLSTSADVGRRKTRVVGSWLEARGYEVLYVERRFDEHQRVAAGEPTVALFGVDNAAARRVMEGCGYRLIIDAGLGSGFRDFRAMRVRTFPGPSSAAALWGVDAGSNGIVELAPAYRHMIAGGGSACGVTTLATRAVGAPFVGCAAAGYVLSELARRELGGKGVGYVDMNLRNPSRMEKG